MIKKFKQPEKILSIIKPKLHIDILNILIENRQDIKNIFLQGKGLFEISHFTLTIIDPAQEIVVFSTTPNIVYNLIYKNLWENDPCFSLSMHKKNTIFWWETADKTPNNERIAKIKLKNNQFSLGMTIARPIEGFYLLYSFATKSQANNLQTYYTSNKRHLINLGDYFYKAMREIYAAYNCNYTPPTISHKIIQNSDNFLRFCPKLIVNNRGK